MAMKHDLRKEEGGNPPWYSEAYNPLHQRCYSRAGAFLNSLSATTVSVKALKSVWEGGSFPIPAGTLAQLLSHTQRAHPTAQCLGSP